MVVDRSVTLNLTPQENADLDRMRADSALKIDNMLAGITEAYEVNKASDNEVLATLAWTIKDILMGAEPPGGSPPEAVMEAARVLAVALMRLHTAEWTVKSVLTRLAGR